MNVVTAESKVDGGESIVLSSGAGAGAGTSAGVAYAPGCDHAAAPFLGLLRFLERASGLMSTTMTVMSSGE